MFNLFFMCSITQASWLGSAQPAVTQNAKKVKMTASERANTGVKVQEVAAGRLKDLESFNWLFRSNTYTFGIILFSGSVFSIVYFSNLIDAGVTGTELDWSITCLVIGILNCSVVPLEMRNSITLDNIENEMRLSINSGDKESFRRASQELLDYKWTPRTIYATGKLSRLEALSRACLEDNVSWGLPASKS